MGLLPDKKIKSLKRSVFNKIFIFFLIPVLLISMISFVTYTYYINLYEVELKEKYRENARALSNTLDDTFYELLETSSLLALDESIRGIMFSSQPLELEDYYDVGQSIETLAHFRSSRNIVDNAYIIAPESSIIISSNGVQDLNLFFDTTYHYQKYAKKYWFDLIEQKPIVKVLRSTSVYNYMQNGNQKQVIPVVQFGMGFEQANKLFVINIKQSELTDIFNNYQLTPNSYFIVADNEGYIYSSTQRGVRNSQINQELLRKSKENQAFTFNLEGKEMLVLTYNSHNSLFKDFLYLALVPQQDIYSKMTFIKNISYLTIIFGLILGVILSFVMSKRLYMPIKSLVRLLTSKDDKEINTSTMARNEFEYLKNEMEAILSNNKHLTEGLSMALPMVVEQYLLKVLNQNDPYIKEEVKGFLADNNLIFEQPYFLAGILDLNFSDDFFKNYSRNERIQIHSKVVEISENVFPKEYQVYVLTLEKDKLCLILNLPAVDIKEVKQFFSKFNELNNEQMIIHLGLGRLYKDINGLQSSYQEARKAIAQTYLFAENIKIYADDSAHTNYYYSLQEEQKMFNFLICGDMDNMARLLDNIIEKNVEARVSNLVMRELYLQLYNTGYRALKAKDNLPREIMNKNYRDIKTEWQEMTIKQLKEYIYLFYHNIIKAHEVNGNLLKIDEVITYINNHLQEDIYLEQLAEQFNTSAKYLSQVIKETLGISFKKYLNQLRIEKAKLLLHEEDQLIKEIYHQVGYNNRTTFIRNFKKFAGVTPSEYQEHFVRI